MAGMNEVVSHIETHLGRINTRGGYWRFPLNGRWLQVLSYPNRPSRGLATLVSLGLSHFELPAAKGRVRQELSLITDRGATRDGRLACLLQTVAETVVGRGTAVEDGEMFGPIGEPLSIAGYAYWAVAVAPSAFGDEFVVCGRTDPATQFVQLELERDAPAKDRDATRSDGPV